MFIKSLDIGEGVYTIIEQDNVFMLYENFGTAYPFPFAIREWLGDFKSYYEALVYAYKKEGENVVPF